MLFESVRAATAARRYLNSRRRRTEALAADLFRDPAWDILLDLFASHVEGARVSVSSACIASGVATTTALRWIADLEQHELVIRRADPRDGRRTFLDIAPHAATAIERWLNTMFVH